MCLSQIKEQPNIGKVADYIPQLAKVRPDYFAISVATVNGQTFSIGDSVQPFCLQSGCADVSILLHCTRVSIQPSTPAEYFFPLIFCSSC